jgi:hypothetical protein
LTVSAAPGFRDQLVFSIGFAVSRSRDLLRRLSKEHAPDDARQMLAERVAEHLEQSGFQVDDDGQALRRVRRSPRTGRLRSSGASGNLNVARALGDRQGGGRLSEL